MLFGSRRHSNRVRIHNVLVDLYRNSSLLILSSTFYVCLLSFVVNSTQLNSIQWCFFFCRIRGCLLPLWACVCVCVCVHRVWSLFIDRVSHVKSVTCCPNAHTHTALACVFHKWVQRFQFSPFQAIITAFCLTNVILLLLLLVWLIKCIRYKRTKANTDASAIVVIAHSYSSSSSSLAI